MMHLAVNSQRMQRPRHEVWSSRVSLDRRRVQRGYLQVQLQVDSSAGACERPLWDVFAALISNLTAHVTVWAVYGTEAPLGCALVRCPLSSEG